MTESFDWGIVFKSPFGFLMVGAAGGILAGIVGTIATNWRRVRVAEQDAALKQNMIERGMSAEDIVRVLSAGKRADK